MEFVDLLDENRLPLGRTAERFRTFAPGEYRSVVHICVFNSGGELLIQKRKADKKLWPGRWDVAAAGGVSAGETSRTAAEREFAEELGVPLDLTGVRPTVTVNFGRGFDDFFVVVRDIPLSALHLQPEEVEDARWVTLAEAQALVDRDEFVTYPKSFLQFLYDMRNQFGFTE